MPLELLTSLRRHAGDPVFRSLLADALIEAGDPRGPAMAETLAGLRVSDWLAVHRRAREGLPPHVERICFEYGLVTQLALDVTQLDAVDPSWLASEPLAVLELTGLYDQGEQLEPLLRRHRPRLALARGVRLGPLRTHSQWAGAQRLLAAVPAQVLALQLGPTLRGELGRPLWPTVELADLKVARGPQLDVLLRRSLPQLRRLRLRFPPFASGLASALAHPTLEHLDLRGSVLSTRKLEALRAWLGPGRSIRHPQFNLAAPDLDGVDGPCECWSWNPLRDPRSR